MAASATLALKPGVWFRRGRLLIVSPDSLGTACPLSGRNSTYRLVQILEAGSHFVPSVAPSIPAPPADPSDRNATVSANDLDMLRRFYDELAQLDELHQELISNPERRIS